MGLVFVSRIKVPSIVFDTLNSGFEKNHNIKQTTIETLSLSAMVELLAIGTRSITSVEPVNLHIN